MVSSGDSQALGDIELHDRRSLFTDGFFRQGKSDELAVELTEADLLGVRAVAACVPVSYTHLTLPTKRIV